MESVEDLLGLQSSGLSSKREGHVAGGGGRYRGASSSLQRRFWGQIRPSKA